MLPPVLIVNQQCLLLPRLLVYCTLLLQVTEVDSFRGARINGRQNVLREAAQEVAGGIVIAHHVHLSIPVPGHSHPQFSAVPPDHLREVTSL